MWLTLTPLVVDVARVDVSTWLSLTWERWWVGNYMERDKEAVGHTHHVIDKLIMSKKECTRWSPPPCSCLHVLPASFVRARHRRSGWRGLVGGGVVTPAPTSFNEGRGEGDVAVAVFALASSSCVSGDDVALQAAVAAVAVLGEMSWRVASSTPVVVVNRGALEVEGGGGKSFQAGLSHR